jgi:hypothetical protein
MSKEGTNWVLAMIHHYLRISTSPRPSNLPRFPAPKYRLLFRLYIVLSLQLIWGGPGSLAFYSYIQSFGLRFTFKFQYLGSYGVLWLPSTPSPPRELTEAQTFPRNVPSILTRRATSMSITYYSSLVVPRFITPPRIQNSLNGFLLQRLGPHPALSESLRSHLNSLHMHLYRRSEQIRSSHTLSYILYILVHVV